MQQQRKKPKEKKEEPCPRIGMPLGGSTKPRCELADGVAVLLSAEAAQAIFGYAYDLLPVMIPVPEFGPEVGIPLYPRSLMWTPTPAP